VSDPPISIINMGNREDNTNPKLIDNNRELTTRPPKNNNKNMVEETKINPPSIPDSFPEVDSLTEEEITILLNNDETLDVFIVALPIVLNMTQVKEELTKGNNSSREDNEKLAKELEKLREEYQRMCNECDTIKKELNEREKVKMSIEQRNSRQSIAQQLSVLAERDDYESEVLVENLLDGEIGDISTFIQAYEEKRNQYWLRKYKSNYLLQGSVR